MITFKEILTEGFKLSTTHLSGNEAKMLNYFVKKHLERDESHLNKMYHHLKENGLPIFKITILLNLYLNNDSRIYKEGKKVIREISFFPDYGLGSTLIKDALDYTLSNYKRDNDVEIIASFLIRHSDYIFSTIIKNALSDKDNNYLYRLWKYFYSFNRITLSNSIKSIFFNRYMYNDNFNPELAKELDLCPKLGKIVFTPSEIADFFKSNEDYYQNLIIKALEGDYGWQDLWNDVDELDNYMWSDIDNDNKSKLRELLPLCTSEYYDDSSDSYIQTTDKSLTDDQLYDIIDSECSDLKYAIEEAHIQAEGDADFDFIYEQIKTEITDFFGPFEFDDDQNIVINFNLSKINKKYILQMIEDDIQPTSLDELLTELKEYIPNSELPSIDTRSFHHGVHPGNMDKEYFNDTLSERLDEL